ncbi:MAG: hypothetical protein COS68_04405, partial [Elusimicrobia bacterium CG06_land_8_20_14_3_00_38_11]
MEWKVGDRIKNRYEIHNIKIGGMGIVYLCYDHETGDPVAIKTFQDKFFLDEKAREKFTQEALIWINLEKHQNIVRAYYVIQIEEQPYIFLEYITGGDLSNWIEEGKLDFNTSLNFAVQFCNGMEYANKKLGGIVHGDIKPQNILITEDGIVKITDFGLTRASGEEAKSLFYLLREGPTILQSGPRGTLPWIAPEQFISDEIDTRADIYSFGIVLYQMFTGGYPYVVSTATPEEFVTNHCKLKPIPPKKINSKIPEEIDSLILKCLEKNPNDRFQNFSQLKNALSDIYYETTGEKIVLEEEPSKLEAWELGNKGVALYNLGRPDEAIECCNKALEINPGCAEVWNNKGSSLSNSGRHNEEIECYDKAIEINPRYAGAWYNKGNALYSLGRP